MELRENYEEDFPMIGLSIWMEDKEKLASLANSLAKKKIGILKTKNSRMRMIPIEKLAELEGIFLKVLSATR